MKRFRNIASLILAGLVLISSVGITVNMHLCGGRVQSVAVFTKAQPCMELIKACHETKHVSKQKGCCEEKSIVFKGKETNAEVKDATSLSPSFSIIGVVLPVLYSIRTLDPSVVAIRYAHYKPPLPKRDITVFVQSFLI